MSRRPTPSETAGAPAAPRKVRCAIYARKSTEKGLDREFSSIDAQREACQAFIASQAGEGWIALVDRYEDGGFTGANMDRPGLKRLMSDVDAGRIDCVVTYKVDRLSRSLLDFARMMEVFDRRSVSFVSVTQHFNTAQPMGRLILNVLLSFAQFEREIIAERTRDKMAASRRKGRWVGGNPILGYDVDIDGRRLVVNEPEAERVREIFRLYAQERSLLDTMRELNRRGWTMKLRTARTGHSVGGRAFDKTRLWGLLTNWTYAGKVRYKGEVFDGEHPAIVPPELWAEVQDILKRHGRGPRGEGKIRHDSLLRGLLVCAHCDTALVNHFTSRGPNRRYHYYVCSSALKNGWGSCPTKGLPAGDVDGFVVEQLREIASDRRLRVDVVRLAREATQSRRTELEADDARIRAELRAARAEVKRLAGRIGKGSSEAASRLVEIQATAQRAESSLEEIRSGLAEIAAQEITDDQVVAALAAFDSTWASLTAVERSRVARLLLERVVYDPASGSLRMTFRPTGIRSLAALGAVPPEES